MKRKSVLAVFLAVAVLGTVVACSKKPNDAATARTIQSDFNTDSGLQGKHIDVEAANGTVTLSGNVDNDAQRTAAARYAAAAPGVRQVVNNIQIGPDTATAASEPPSDEATQAAPAPAPEPARSQKPAPSRHDRHAWERRSHDEGESDARSDTGGRIAQAPPAPAPLDAPAQAAGATLPPPPPPAPHKVIIPSGTAIGARLIDPISSETAQPNDTFRATLSSPLVMDGEVVIPAGYDLSGHVVNAENGGKFTGKAQLTLQLDRISVDGRHYNLQTDEFHRETAGRGKNTAEKVGAGTVLGAIIGGIAGGGKGAAIGAAAGGGVGGGAQAATKAPQVKLPSEYVVNFSLQAPLTVTPTTRPPREERPKLENNNQ
jgi:hypothetical protein